MGEQRGIPDSIYEAPTFEAVRVAAPWQPGDPEPANEYPYAIHACPPGADPWATFCGRRVPRSALAHRPEEADCADCRREMGLDNAEPDNVRGG